MGITAASATCTRVHGAARTRAHAGSASAHRAPTHRRLVDRRGLVVSATSLTADGDVRALRRPHVPNYALRRAVAAAVAVLACGLAAAGVTTVLAGVAGGFGGSPAVASEAPSGAVAQGAVVARPGDTLWSIASRHRGEVGHDRYLDALVRLNGGPSIQAGQVVVLP